MAKRKYSFLADEDEKYEQEYQREIAHENKLKENEIKTQLANKGKQGVSMVSGNISPIIGELNTYHIVDWYPDTPMKDRNPANVTWELFRERGGGKFTTTHIKKVGVSSFTFGQTALGGTFRLEAYLHHPEGGGLIIKPKASKIPKIGKIDLYYFDDKKGDTFSFYDRLRAKAHTTSMFGKEIVFTLWEDDVKGDGHDAKNEAIEIKTAYVQDNGLAVVEFTLTKALMKKAMKGEAHAEELEFYVTAEYYKGKIHDSENVNVKNPLYWTLGVVPPPIGTKKPERKPTVKAKNSPAEKKPTSKREEKNILLPQAKDYLQHDWAEIKGKALRNKEITIFTDYGNSLAGVKSQPAVKQEGKCLCEQYDLIWGNKVSCEFRKKVVEICAELWGEENKIKMANYLMAIFRWESGGTFKPDVPNQANSGGTGLIQFMPSTAKHLLGKEVTIEIVKNYFGKKYNKITKKKEDSSLKRVKEFADMTAVQQLDYVKEFFKDLKGKNLEFVDIYLKVLFPASSSLPEHVVFATDLNKLDRSFESEKLRNKRVDSYWANKGLDLNGDGKIMKSEIKTKVQPYITEGLLYSKIEKCENIKDENKKSEIIGGCTEGKVKDGFIYNSLVTKNEITSCNKHIMPKKVEIIVLHRTAGGKASGTLTHMAKEGYGAHFVVDYDGTVYQTIGLDKKGSHMGVRQYPATIKAGWGNGNSIAIETCGYSIDKDGNKRIGSKYDKIPHDHWELVTNDQAKSVACLLKFLLNHFTLKIEDVKVHEKLCQKEPNEGTDVYNAMLKYFNEKDEK